MTEGLKWTVNEVPKSDDKHLELMSEENVKKANEFHKSFPQYSVTPLQNLSSLAKYLGVKNIFCKDESYRFGLNAFKVLGGSYAMGRYIAKEVGRDISELPYNVLSSDKLREEFGQATFFTATDGNHGRGVAWAANKLGQKAVVHMPKGSTQTRFDNIAKEGASVTIEELNYDDCVRLAAKEAAEKKAAEEAAAKKAAQQKAAQQAASATEKKQNTTSTSTTTNTTTSKSDSSTTDTTIDTSKGKYLGRFKLTAYCSCSICCGKWSGGGTAIGTTPTPGRTIAMAGVPFGTKLSINGQIYTVEDRGTAYGHVDIFMGSHSQALSFGMKYADVYQVN